MIILGAKYKLQNFEKEKLGILDENIHYIVDELKDLNIFIENIKSRISMLKYNIIILNMKQKISSAIVDYLNKLKVEKNILLYTMEQFLEDRLNKCYIPEQKEYCDCLNIIQSYSKWQYFQKRCIDYFGVFWLLFFSWPVMLWCVIKIKQQSPGKIFFKQFRVSRDNKKFECLKFRSMHENTKFFNHYTQDNDPRIFAWGSVMRKTRFDELPQIWNIIKGDMHLIGPRAEWSELVEKYEKEISLYNKRHLVAPGVTGCAQVNYPYGANMEDTRQKLMYDLYYIKYWNIWLELKIVWKTALVVMGRNGI